MRGFPRYGWLAALFIGMAAGSAYAETIELVTYYPSQANTGDLHVRSLTVGDGIRNDTPPDGVALVFDELGVGLPPGTTDPAGPLHVVGVDGEASSVVFVPGAGAGSAIRVGIGTANPGSALHVVTTTETTAFFDLFSNVAGAGPQPATRRARGTPAAPLAVQNNDDLGGIGFAGHDGADFRVGAVIDASVDGAPAAGNVPSRIDVATNDGTTLQARLSIRANGNVGIGTGDPQTALHVSGVNHGMRITDPNLPNRRVLLGTNQGGDAVFLELSQDTTQYMARTWQLDVFPNNRFAIVQPGQVDRVTVLPNGNVGIGTVNPGNPLEVSGVIEAQHAPAFPNHQVQIGTMSPVGAAAIGFLTNLRPPSTVNQFSNSLAVRGGAIVFDPGQSKFWFSGNRVSAAQNAVYDPFAAANIIMVLDVPNGRVGIRRIAATHPLEVQGTAGKTGGGQLWANISDGRVKTDIRPVENALAALEKLRPVHFRYADWYRQKNPDVEDHPSASFVAQEYAKVFPHSVTPDEEGYLYMNASDLLPYLVSAVQELREENDILRRRTEALEKKVRSASP